MGGRRDPHKNRHTAADDMSVRAGRMSREATGNAAGSTCCAGGGAFTADWARAVRPWSAGKNGTSGRFEHGPMLALVRQLPFENGSEFPGSERSGRHFTALNMSPVCFFTLPRVSEKQD